MLATRSWPRDFEMFGGPVACGVAGLRRAIRGAMTVDTLVSQRTPSTTRLVIAYSKTVSPHRLDGTERTALLRELRALNQEIFDGPGLPAVTEALASGTLGLTTIQLYFDEADRCVGYACLLCDELDHEGEPWTVFRAMTGLLPAYRKRQSVLGFYIATITAYLLRNPRRRTFFFTPIVHISSYRLVARHAREMYPHPEQPVPPSIAEIMQWLGARYACTPVEGEHPLVCRRSVWVRGTQGAKASRLEQGDAFDRFFHQLNPRFSEGLCVMTLAPVTLRQVLTAALRYCRTRASVLLRRLRGAGARGWKALEA
jgi:hypothetical protein